MLWHRPREFDSRLLGMSSAALLKTLLAAAWGKPVLKTWSRRACTKVWQLLLLISERFHASRRMATPSRRYLTVSSHAW